MHRIRQARFTFVHSLCLCTLAVTPCAAEKIPSFNRRTAPATASVSVGTDPQLLIDDFIVAGSDGLTKVVHPARRVLDRPILGWEQGVTQPFLKVLRDPESGKFRMWYNKHRSKETAIAYAESDDGVHWTLPSLGILGNDNRVLLISAPHQNGYGVSLIDEGPRFTDKARRFKMAWWGQEKPWVRKAPDGGGDPGLRVAFSPDGLRWAPWKGNPVLPDFGEPWFADDPRRSYGVGDIVDAYWDPLRQHYGALLKTPAVASDGFAKGVKADNYLRRLVSCSTSPDFIQWERPWRVIMPEPRDEGHLEFYSAGGVIARGGLLIAFSRMLRDDLPANPGGPVEGIGWAAIVTSRDGRHWERHDGVFLDRSPDPEAWDRAMAWIGSTVPVGPELYVYYGGYKRGHKVAPEKERQLGLAKVGLDRFVSRTAEGETPGLLRTVPLRIPDQGQRILLVNALATGGFLRVQVRDATGGRVLPGFSWQDCSPLTGDGQALPVCWRSRSGLPAGDVQLEFEVRRAALFGFRLAPAPIE